MVIDITENIPRELSPVTDSGDQVELVNNYSELSNCIEADVQNALSLLRKDIGRQLGLASDRYNTLLQSIGILVAFASILFLQLLAIDPVFAGYGILFASSMLSVFFCCIVGILSILRSSRFALSAGIAVDKETDLFKKGEIEDFEMKIAIGLDKAYETTYENNTRLTEIIRYMVVLLLLGIIAMFAGWWLA